MSERRDLYDIYLDYSYIRSLYKKELKDWVKTNLIADFKRLVNELNNYTKDDDNEYVAFNKYVLHYYHSEDYVRFRMFPEYNEEGEAFSIYVKYNEYGRLLEGIT